MQYYPVPSSYLPLMIIVPPLINDHPPKTPRSYHLIVDNNNIPPIPRVTTSDKYRNKKNRTVPIYTI